MTKDRNFQNDPVFACNDFTFSLADTVIPYKSFDHAVRPLSKDTYVELMPESLKIADKVVYRGKVQDVLGLDGLMAVLTGQDLMFMN